MAQLRMSSNPLSSIRLPVWITALAWIAAVVLAIVLGNEYGLFDRPNSIDLSVLEQVIAPQFAALEALAVIALVMWMTRKRPKIDVAAIGIPRDEAIYVLKAAVVYGFIAIMGGMRSAMGWIHLLSAFTCPAHWSVPTPMSWSHPLKPSPGRCTTSLLT